MMPVNSLVELMTQTRISSILIATTAATWIMILTQNSERYVTYVKFKFFRFLKLHSMTPYVASNSNSWSREPACNNQTDPVQSKS
jgi:hypothetical protein